MTRFFEKKDYWGNNLTLWVLVGMVFIFPLACWSLTHIDLQNDVNTWLPKNDPSARTLNWYSQHFGEDAHILMTWDGSSLQDPRLQRLSKRLTGEVGKDGIRRFGLNEVKEVVIPQTVLSRMLQYDVSPEDALKRLDGTLIGRGLAKIRLTEEGRARQDKVTKMLVEQARSELQMEIQIVPAFTEWQDETYFEEEWSDEADAAEEGTANAVTHDSQLTRVSGESTAVLDETDELTETDEAADALPIPPSLHVPAHDFQVRWKGMRPDSREFERFRRLVMDLRLDRAPSRKSESELVEDCFFAPGTPVAMIVTLSEAGNAEPAIAIKKITEQAKLAGIPTEQLHMGGRPVTTATMNTTVKTVVWNKEAEGWNLPARSGILTAVLVSAVLSIWTLRNGRLAVFVQLVAIYTTVLAVALVPPTGGSMNMVLVVMPVLLLVITLSGAIHLVNYWQHAVTHNPDQAVQEAVRMARTPVLLAGVTTAIGLISLTTSTLVPVRDFGIYSAIGCLISLVVILYGLPSILQFWPAKVNPEQELRRVGWRAIAQYIHRFRWAIYILCLACFVSGLYSLKWFKTETKVIRYFADSSDIVHDYHFIEENLSGIIPLDIVIRFDRAYQEDKTILDRMEIVRAITDELRKHPEISGALSLADFRPVSEIPPPDASFRVQAKYRKTAQITENRIMKTLETERNPFFSIADKSVDLDRPGDAGIAAEGDELWHISAQSAVMSNVSYAELTKQIDECVQSVLKFHPGTHHVVTGTVPLFLRTQQAVLDSLIVSFGIAFFVIGVIMVIFLKNPVSGLISMIPNILPVAVVFGLISYLGMAVDIGTMVTASVALGIAVDGTLHLLSWFRDGISQGMSRKQAIVEGISHCAPAMCQTSMIISLGLMVLYPTELLLVSRFAWVTASLIGVALISDLLLLPALLAGTLGSMIEKNVCQVPRTVPLSSAVEKKYQPHVMNVPTRAAKKKLG